MSWSRTQAFTFGSSTLTLIVNVATGVLIARALGTSGRGELTAIIALPATISWIFAMGCFQAVSYHQAKHPEDGGRLITSWLVLLVPLSAIAIGAGYVLLPALFAAQTDAAMDLARIYLLTIVFALFAEVTFGILLGDQDFRLLQRGARGPARPYGGCLSGAVAGRRVHRQERASRHLPREHQRLRRGAGSYPPATPPCPSEREPHPVDPLVRDSRAWRQRRRAGERTPRPAHHPGLPCRFQRGYLRSRHRSHVRHPGDCRRAVGAGTPAAARQGAQGVGIVIRSLHTTLAVAVFLAVGLAVLAEPAITLVYGDAFDDSVMPLRLLLPGTVLYAAASILWSGLYAVNRPFTATVAQVAGALVTVVGLLLFLRTGGINAAALVTTASYAVVFGAAIILYRRAVEIRWSDFVPGRFRTPGPVTADTRVEPLAGG